MMNDQRRKLIKGLGTAWTTPVVSSIILPAHAQTSSTTPAPGTTTTQPPTPTTTQAPMPAPLTIPGFSIDYCSSTVPPNQSFDIDDSNVSAPSLIAGTNIVIELEHIQFEEAYISLDISGRNVGSGEVEELGSGTGAECPISANTVDPGGPFSSRTVTGNVNGTIYMVSGEFSVAGSVVTMSDIIFTPM